jgi:glycosyltransferase involved in cell wall biosynthesis
MRPARIDQVVHILAYNDAIGTHVLHMRDVLRKAGFASDIYAGEVHPQLRQESRPVEDLPLQTQPGTWILFHHSIGTTVAEAVLRRSEPLLIDYHNITPAALVDRWAPWVTEELELGVDQLGLLAPKAFYGWAHSHFSETELSAAGCAQTSVVPALFTLSGRETATDNEYAQTLGTLRAGKYKGGSDWLFVGRISPHKAQHDLIKALQASRSFYDPEARLHLVGTSLGIDYPRALERFSEMLGVAGSVNMTGAVSASALSAYFASADVFVCASDHEGFCVPLVEAMGKRIPVVAYDATAVGETVGGAGLLVSDKSALEFAATVDRITSDPELRRRLVALGKQRAAELSLPASATLVTAAVEAAVKVAESAGLA